MATKKEKIAAAKSDGLQRCETCQFRMGLTCDENTMKVCSVKYREGFLRGIAWKQRQNKNVYDFMVPIEPEAEDEEE